MRQLRKQILTILAALWLAAPGAAMAQSQSLVTAIVTDPLTGIAIEGYDPVSYFLGAVPSQGVPDYEYYWGGVPWHFSNAANRDIFMRSPETYAPQFGGHCLTSLSRGYLSDGKPRLYAIEGLKLYFFYSAANRDAFLLSRGKAIHTAEINWPRLRDELSGAGSELPASSAMAVAAAAPAVAPDGATDTLHSN